MSQFVFEFIANCFFALAEWIGLVKDDGKPLGFSSIVRFIVGIVLIIVVVVYLLTP